MKKEILLIVMLVFFISLTTATSYTYQKDEAVNYRFRCINLDYEYCPTSTIVSLNVEAPNGTSIYDNSTLTANPTYFNHTLPTDSVGIYSVFIVAPSVNATTEFTYEVTVSGLQSPDTGQGMIIIASLLLIVLFGMFSFWAGNKSENQVVKMAGIIFGLIFLSIGLLYNTLLLQQITGGFENILSGFDTFVFILGIGWIVGIATFMIFVVLMIWKAWSWKRGFLD